MSKVAIILIRIYQKSLSPILNHFGIRCRFYPTCSEYGILAIKRYGFLNGIKKIYKRLKRCRPDNFDSCIDFP